MKSKWILKTSMVLLLAIVCSSVYRCPFKLLFKLDCPGCGMTRAWLSALHFDFTSAFQYHPLFWLFGIETAYVFIINFTPLPIRRNKNAELIIGILSLSALLIVWYIRQFII